MNHSRGAKIVYGVCGIGLGHFYRQLPIIEELVSREHELEIFAYGQSLSLLTKRFHDRSKVKIREVAVPYLVGSPAGIDFATSAELPANKRDFFAINARVLEQTSKRFGRPDLVVTDYEPNAAQYAYTFGAPLITIDQQSKYLMRTDWPTLNNLNCVDEVMRLRLFFPKADARLACSFFKVERQDGTQEDVQILAPVIRPQLANSPRRIQDQKFAVVYLSGQRAFRQSIDEIVTVLATAHSWRFSLYVESELLLPEIRSAHNVRVYPHGSEQFEADLRSCAALISTAGHSLLSEAIFLGLPTYSMPLPVYEQEMNSLALVNGGVGVRHDSVEEGPLGDFLTELPRFTARLSQSEIFLATSSDRDIVDNRIARFLS